MKYYLIVGEASGDLHASHLMAALKVEDPQAEYRQVCPRKDADSRILLYISEDMGLERIPHQEYKA